jgi:hypothetical protein
MPSDIDNASNALQMIGDEPISSFDDPGAGASVAKALYEPLAVSMLTRTYWTFALKKLPLNRISSTPLNEWQYEFQMPSDMLRVLKVYPRSEYKIYQDRIYSNSQSLAIDYIFRANTSEWPAYFTLAFTYKLASEFALAVTDKPNKNAIYEEKFREAMASAYSADAQGNPQTPILDMPFIDSRFNGFG